MIQDDRTNRLRVLLLKYWDPLEVSDNPNLSNEYDRYLSDILRLLDSHCTEEQLQQHLAKMEAEEMGLEPAPELTARAAQALFVDWKNEQDT